MFALYYRQYTSRHFHITHTAPKFNIQEFAFFNYPYQSIITSNVYSLNFVDLE